MVASPVGVIIHLIDRLRVDLYLRCGPGIPRTSGRCALLDVQRHICLSERTENLIDVVNLVVVYIIRVYDDIVIIHEALVPRVIRNYQVQRGLEKIEGFVKTRTQACTGTFWRGIRMMFCVNIVSED